MGVVIMANAIVDPRTMMVFRMFKMFETRTIGRTNPYAVHIFVEGLVATLICIVEIIPVTSSAMMGSRRLVSIAYSTITRRAS